MKEKEAEEEKKSKLLLREAEKSTENQRVKERQDKEMNEMLIRATTQNRVQKEIEDIKNTMESKEEVETVAERMRIT